MIQRGRKMLSAKALSVGFSTATRQKILFDKIDLDLHAGELICFMGPNGSGKSSLIRTLASLQAPLSGSVELNQTGLSVQKNISVVLTNRITGGNVTVRDLVTYGRYPYLDWNVKLKADDRLIIDDAMRKVRIDGIAESEITQLSDGQIQMAMIARAIAQDTPVILLDEPTAHLDLNNRVEIMKLLKKLTRESGKAILVSTHELDLALQIADLIWLTGKQKNILKGIPEDLVLNGSFDAIFELKGFDLRTGKIQHDADAGTTIYIDGVGPEYLWTRNALERLGLNVVGPDGNRNESAWMVKVVIDQNKPLWILEKNNQLFRLNSIAALLELL